VLVFWTEERTVGQSAWGMVWGATHSDMKPNWTGRWEVEAKIFFADVYR
jgi:hypothetical protein